VNDVPTLTEIERGEIIQLTIRSRWRRALRAPELIWYYHRHLGLPWLAAICCAHVAVWYRPKTREEHLQ
jgi:hypothetical protein